MPPDRKSFFLMALLASTQARAVTVRVDSAAGLMQQPTSHYYHLIYGGQVTVATQTENVFWRGSYLERPAFKTVGYKDKDYGWFALVGTKLTKTKDYGVFASIGAGQVAGYIKSDKAAAGITRNERRSYRLRGPTVALDYEVRFGPVQWSIGHQTFVGFVDRSEVEAYVAWPYNFFQTTLGVVW